MLEHPGICVTTLMNVVKVTHRCGRSAGKSSTVMLTDPSETTRRTLFSTSFEEKVLRDEDIVRSCGRPQAPFKKVANKYKSMHNTKHQLKLSSEQREILVGLLLGDGHLETQNGGRSYRLKVEHSLKQRDYLEWLFMKFRNLSEQSELTLKKRKDGRKSLEFRTSSLGTFRFYAHQFYDENGKKRVPKQIYKWLKPLSLAIWYADDGSRKSLKHKTFIIHTLAFSKSDLKLLQEALLKNFGIKSVLHRNRQAWRIYIPSESAIIFSQVLNEYLRKFQSMQHKLVTRMPKK